jgi:hypothetical protein
MQRCNTVKNGQPSKLDHLNSSSNFGADYSFISMPSMIIAKIGKTPKIKITAKSLQKSKCVTFGKTDKLTRAYSQSMPSVLL